MRLIYCLFILSLLTACDSGKEVAKTKKRDDPYAAYTVDFVKSGSLNDAIDKATAENKLVFVDFYADWCLPCKMMDENVFVDPAFGDYFNKNFVSLKVNAEKANGPDLAMLYSVRAYPTLLFLDTRGRVLTRKEGAAFQSELRTLGAEALAQLP